MGVKVIPITPAYRDGWERMTWDNDPRDKPCGGVHIKSDEFIHPDYCANPLPLAHPVWMFRREDLR